MSERASLVTKKCEATTNPLLNHSCSRASLKMRLASFYCADLWFAHRNNKWAIATFLACNSGEPDSGVGCFLEEKIRVFMGKNRILRRCVIEMMCTAEGSKFSVQPFVKNKNILTGFKLLGLALEAEEEGGEHFRSLQGVDAIYNYLDGMLNRVRVWGEGAKRSTIMEICDCVECLSNIRALGGGIVDTAIGDLSLELDKYKDCTEGIKKLLLEYAEEEDNWAAEAGQGNV